MNSETSNTWVQFQQYHKPEAQQLIESVKTQLGQDAKEAGKRDAESNLPRKGDKLLLFISHLLVQIQGLINDLRNLHKADEDVVLRLHPLDMTKRAADGGGCLRTGWDVFRGRRSTRQLNGAQGR